MLPVSTGKTSHVAVEIGADMIEFMDEGVDFLFYGKIMEPRLNNGQNVFEFGFTIPRKDARSLLVAFGSPDGDYFALEPSFDGSGNSRRESAVFKAKRGH